MKEKKKRFIKRYNDTKEYVIKAMDKALERAIGNEVIDFDKCKDNYTDVYPLIAAVLKRELDNGLGKSVSDKIYRSTKRKMNNYLNNYKIWQDYAGDYKSRELARMFSLNSMQMGGFKMGKQNE